MTLSETKDFEDALSQLCRFYRAEREMYATTDASDKDQITRWVRTGGKIMEKMDEVLSDIEVFSGTAELRVITAELKQMRQAKEENAEKT